MNLTLDMLALCDYAPVAGTPTHPAWMHAATFGRMPAPTITEAAQPATPTHCACFPGCCRGGQVIGGRTVGGG